MSQEAHRLFFPSCEAAKSIPISRAFAKTMKHSDHRWFIMCEWHNHKNPLILFYMQASQNKHCCALHTGLRKTLSTHSTWQISAWNQGFPWLLKKHTRSSMQTGTWFVINFSHPWTKAKNISVSICMVIVIARTISHTDNCWGSFKTLEIIF